MGRYRKTEVAHLKTERRVARAVAIGGVLIGHSHPIAIQSMTNIYTHDIRATVAQIKHLEKAGCEIVRCAVPDDRALKALPEIIRRVRLPVVADIHFRADLAVAALEAGVPKVRINPGNIGGREPVKRVLRAALDRGASIRIGVNAGSLEPDILRKHGHPCAAALAESMLRWVEFCESQQFRHLVLSIKSTSLRDTIAATRTIAHATRYPLHIGITEAGTREYGTVKSALGIGILLLEGIGDTVRVSLAGDPVPEIAAARMILKAAGARPFGPEIITCPTCGRTRMDVAAIARTVEDRTRTMRGGFTVAVMGCEVNGPGEAREADIGVACGRDRAVLFVKGERIRTIPARRVVTELMAEIRARFGDK
ncbi:MAG: flavodoxin-dependent (E)-4-hydroxy-3-methylbut-2-enyl-diphosphate synthase [Planctomycetota bacterium]